MTEDIKKWVGEVEEFLKASFDEALKLQLNLSDRSDDYDFAYIIDKVAKCSSYIEKLSNIQMSLVRLSMESTRKMSTAKSMKRLKESALKCSEEYSATSRDQKSAWVQEQMEDVLEYDERCTYITRLVSEVRDAVAERMQMIKRLDSDIRLQQKILEMKVSVGADSASSSQSLKFRPKPETVGEMDLT